MERQLATRLVAADAVTPSNIAARNPPGGLWRSPTLLAAVVLSALGLAAFTVALFAGVTLIPEPLPWIPIPVVAALSALACYQVASQAALPHVVRRFWRHVGFAVAMVGAGGTLQAADLIAGRPADVLTPWTSALYLTSIGTFLWALFRLPVGVSHRPQRRTIWLDTWTVTVATGLFVYQLWIRAVIGAAVNAFQVWLSYLLLGLVMVGILALTKIALTAAALLDRRALHALALAVLFSSVCGSAEPLFTGRQHINIAIAVIPVAAALVGLAAEQQRVAARADDVRTSGAAAHWPFSVLPYLAVAAADVLLLAVAARGGDRANMLIIGSGVAMITGLVVMRQLTALRENALLVQRLDAGLANIRAQERRFRSLVQNTSDLIAVAALEGTLTYISPGIQRVLGASAEDWIGKSAWDAVHPGDHSSVRDQLRRIAAVPEATTTIQMRLAHRDGSWRWAEVSCVNLQDEPGVSGIVFNARDVTESREFQDRLRHAATHDSLTGLANRVLFADSVHRSVTTSAAGHQLSVVLMDLDNFKSINDTLGHTVGDALLVSAAQRLKSSLRPTDTVARLGGDEFAILLDGVGAADTDAAVELLIACLSEPLFALGYELLIQASFGIACGHQGDSGPELLRHADVAMYVAKAQGDGRFAHYHPDMESRSVEHAQLAAELRQALESRQFVVAYQPIVELPGSRLASVEALVRWQHPVRGVVQPSDFIQAAERSGLILPLGRWVLRESCRQAARWRTAHGNAAPASVSVNVAARQLRDPCFAAHVAEALTESGLDPHRLTIEITETAAVGGGHTAVTLHAIHALGVRLALDDFGTGHSSLSLLQDCPVDQLKLDRSFVGEQASGTKSAAVAVIQLARALGLDAVAEGVETGQQSDELREIGYQRAQGFHFARPMSPAAIEELITTGIHQQPEASDRRTTATPLAEPR